MFRKFGPWHVQRDVTRRRPAPISQRRMRLPNHDKDGWCLGDAEVSHRKYPKTYWIPDVEKRRNLQTGDLVQLVFRINLKVGPDERMWVIVREVTRDGYIGMLDNVPFTLYENKSLWVGSEFAFAARHVIDCQPATKKSLAAAKAPPAIPWARRSRKRIHSDF